MAAIGEDRSRFNSAQEIQNYAGLSPVTERSGQSHRLRSCASDPAERQFMRMLDLMALFYYGNTSNLYNCFGVCSLYYF